MQAASIIQLFSFQSEVVSGFNPFMTFFSNDTKNACLYVFEETTIFFYQKGENLSKEIVGENAFP